MASHLLNLFIVVTHMLRTQGDVIKPKAYRFLTVLLLSVSGRGTEGWHIKRRVKHKVVRQRAGILV